MVLCGDSYITPSHNDNTNFGASYRVNSDNTLETNEDHQHNLDKLKQNFPTVASQLNKPVTLTGRVSVRCTTPDYSPIAGPICDAQIFDECFKELKKNRKWTFNQEAPFLKGLFVNLGHGSRGLSSAPICAELIAAQVNQEPWPMPKALAELLNPNRFLVKALLKK